MNAVNVVATYNIDALAAPQPPADLRLSAMLGKGPALGKSQWTKYTTIFNLFGSVVNARARMRYDIF